MAIRRSRPAEQAPYQAPAAQWPARKGLPQPLPKSTYGQLAIPYHDMPVWDHREYGAWKPVAGPPADDAEMLYASKLEDLLLRKAWEYLAGGVLPEYAFARMHPADGSDPWCSVDMMVVRCLKDPWLQPFIRSLEKDNRLCVLRPGGKSPAHYLYVSPFFEWGLAEYWENGYYDK